jgi:predicted heme/steroid binding protein
MLCQLSRICSKKLNKSQLYGINYNNSTDAFIRLGKSVGFVANSAGGTNNFDNVLPWAGMRRCNLADDGVTVNAYYGEPGYIEDGSNGQCMVEVPAFYYAVAYNRQNEIDWYISPTKVNGTVLHPWFYDENRNPVTKKYFSAYEGSVYDVSASAYITNDAQTTDFTATTGDKLSSIAGAKPCSGLTQDLTIVKSRIIANNRGTKWQQAYYHAVSALQMLFVVEYASFNTQNKIGKGVTELTDDGATNMALVTGGTTSLGNVSGEATGTDGLVSISYRGVENLWGNIWLWTDGFNINNGFAYISSLNASFNSASTSGNYVLSGELAHSNGYGSNPLLNPSHKSGFLPTAVSGSASTKLCDYYYQNSVGAFVALLGGQWNSGTTAGAFYWSLYGRSSGRGRSVGARLCV